MSKTRPETTRSSSSSSIPRISSASRLSISVQLVDVPTMSTPSRAYGASRLASRCTTGRASSNMPLDWSGSPQQSCLGTSTAMPLCSSSATVISPRSRLVVVRAAAVEERDLARQRRASGASCAQPWNVRPAKRGIGASRCSPSALLADQPAAACCAASSSRAAPPASPARPAQVGRAMIRSRSLKPVSLLQPRARLRVDLGDVDALRADLGADPAARAVVDRGVGRRLVGRRGSARPAARRTSGPGTAA